MTDNDNLRGLHTYTVHLSLLARDDADARALAEKIYDLVTQYHGHAEDASEFHDGQCGSPVDSVFTTDADDWAEHIDLEFCPGCDKPVDRERAGIGWRVCAQCAPVISVGGQYPIAEVMI